MKTIQGIVLALMPTIISALNPITIKGSKFFDSKTGDQFFVKGVAYQPREQGGSDPLTDAAGCKRDAAIMKELGINTIRVYEVHSDGTSHTECMSQFEQAGIYLMLDLAIPKKSINRNEPRYDTEILKQYQLNIEEFAKYSNTLAFLAGNEVTNDVKTTKASAYVKAALRDAKKIVSKLGRKIPVGYADNDDPGIRANIQSYFNCGDEEERADFYGINIYSWCGTSGFKESGFDQRTNELKDYSVPVVLSEYGCNNVTPRPFTEIQSIYGPDMNQVFSGGIAYEYTQEENNYGLVQITKGELKKLPDFENFKSQMTKATFSLKGIKMDSYTPQGSPKKCPAISDKWQAGEKLPPTPSFEACGCAMSTVSCQLNAKGAQPENGEKVGKAIGYACEHGHCDLIASDPAKGIYGLFSTCNTTVSNSLVFDTSAKAGAKCDFDGFAQEINPGTTSIKQCSQTYQLSLQENYTPNPDQVKSNWGGDKATSNPDQVKSVSGDKTTPNTSTEVAPSQGDGNSMVTLDQSGNTGGAGNATNPDQPSAGNGATTPDQVVSPLAPVTNYNDDAAGNGGTTTVPPPRCHLRPSPPSLYQ